MAIYRKDIVEISHLTHENKQLFGVTHDQLCFINDLLYRSPIHVHNLVLEKLFYAGFDAARYKITKGEATKLINNLTTGIEFTFIEYDTPEWHKLKIEEKKLKLTIDYVDYDNCEF